MVKLASIWKGGVGEREARRWGGKEGGMGCIQDLGGGFQIRSWLKGGGKLSTHRGPAEGCNRCVNSLGQGRSNGCVNSLGQGVATVGKAEKQT